MEVLHSNLNHLVHIKLKEKKLSERYVKHYPAKEAKWYNCFISEPEPEMWSEENCLVYDKVTEKKLNEYGYSVDADRKVYSDSRTPIVYKFATNEKAKAFVDNILKLCVVEGNFINLENIKITEDEQQTNGASA
jgi:hypothetical protein